MLIEEIKNSIGAHVILNGRGDLAMSHELRPYISNDKGLSIVKVTKGGLVHLQDENGSFVTVPPKNVEIAPLKNNESVKERFVVSMDKRRKGIYKKYFVERTDGSSGNGGKHEHCQYFVLDVTHDKFAIPALRAYAEACAVEYPVLSVELQTLVSARLKAAESQATDA